MHSNPLLISIFALLLSGAARGEIFEVAGFAEKVKEAKIEPQHQSQWCWAASVQGLLANGGIPRTQEQIVFQTYKTLVNLPAADPRQLYTSLNSDSLTDKGHHCFVRSRYYWGSPSAEFMKQEIENNRPVMLWYRNPDGRGGHSILVFKISYRKVYGFPIVDHVEYFDPWPGKGIQRASREQLAPLVQVYFSVKVSVQQAEAENTAKGAEALEPFERAREIAHQLFTAEDAEAYDKIREDFSNSLKASLSADRIDREMTRARDSVGEFRRTGEPLISTQDNLTAYDVECTCEDGSACIRVVYDREKKICGLWIFPISEGDVERGKTTREIAFKLFQRDYGEVREKFADTLAGNLSTDAMDKVMVGVKNKVGSILSTGSPAASSHGEDRVFSLPCVCENGKVIVRVTFNGEDEVNGLWVLPVAP